MDLGTYLTRIGLDSSTTYSPTLETLAKVQLAHLQSIPFENLDVVLRESIAMGPEAVRDKLLARRRGGYCFEQVQACYPRRAALFISFSLSSSLPLFSLC